MASRPQLSMNDSLSRRAVMVGVVAVSGGAVLAACGVPLSRMRFKHGQIVTLPDGLLLADSYHVSRYNTNTGRLTTEMFENVVASLRQQLDAPSVAPTDEV